MRKKLMVLCLFVLSLFVGGTIQAKADSQQVDYSILPILPANQLDRGNTFYDLKVKPGTQQTLQLQINNFSQEEQTFILEVHQATTNRNLAIDYSGETVTRSAKEKTAISKIVQLPASVTIPGGKAGVVSITLTILEEHFAGVLLAGSQVKKAPTQEQTSGLTTEYDYIVGLMLTESDETVAPELAFGGIAPAVITNNAGLQVHLKNTRPMYLNQVHMVGKIYSASDQTTPVITREIKEGGIAPDSDFKIDFFNGTAGATEPLAAGDYLLKMTLTDGQGHQWQFDESFTISQKQASSINQQVFTVAKDNTLLWGIIGILLALLMILLLLLRKKHRQKN